MTSQQTPPFYSAEFRRIFLAPLFLAVLLGGAAYVSRLSEQINENAFRSLNNDKRFEKLELRLNAIQLKLELCETKDAAHTEAIHRLQIDLDKLKCK